VDVTITATIENGGAKLTKRFIVTVVRKESPTPAEALAHDLADLAVGYYGSDSESSVTTHVVLPAIGGWGSEISWESSDESIMTADGTVSRPTGADAGVTLTATLTNDAESTTKLFHLTVIATDGTDILRQILDDTNDLEIVYAGSDSPDFVSQDLTLRTSGANGCAIEWESSDESIVSAGGVVTRPNADTQVTLEATVQKYSEEIDYLVCRTKTFTVTVAENGSMSVEGDLDDVEIVYAAGDSAESVTSSVYPTNTGATGCRITWTIEQHRLHHRRRQGHAPRAGRLGSRGDAHRHHHQHPDRTNGHEGLHPDREKDDRSGCGPGSGEEPERL
jgi:hypothetical protein